jgi:hypothetical protein
LIGLPSAKALSCDRQEASEDNISTQVTRIIAGLFISFDLSGENI